MFGYVKTDFPNLYVKDTVLYKAMYCGLCKSIGKSCGQKGRFLLNYDLTFLSVFLHNVMGIDIKIEPQKCAIHWIVKRPIALTDDLTERIAALNVILAYHKVKDDIFDSGKGRTLSVVFSSSYKRAKKNEPELDTIVKKMYDDLVIYEKKNGDSVDMAADPFGVMMREIVKILSKDYYTDEVGEVAYCLGKWVYLIDALDDFDKDKKKKNYNVFVNMFKDIQNKEQLVKNKQQELFMIFSGVLSMLAENAKAISYKFNHDLIDNVLLRGLCVQTKQIMENEKCKNSTKF